ncbi:MAG: hypothetical protein WCL03_02980 [Bacteroidota bacterium]
MAKWRNGEMAKMNMGMSITPAMSITMTMTIIMTMGIIIITKMVKW